MLSRIKSAIAKFNLNLKDKIVLTEAATGNFVVTPIIAAMAGARVIAVGKDSKYGSLAEAQEQIYHLASQAQVVKEINVLQREQLAEYHKLDIVTNTGFVRPINEEIITKLRKDCVISLMWEPWEFRHQDVDLAACMKKGITVYGTNESDPRLSTMTYLGYIVLYFLLKQNRTPFSSSVLVLGNKKFVEPIAAILKKNNYEFDVVINYEESIKSIDYYNAIVFAEHERDKLLLGENGYILPSTINEDTSLIHICGNVDVTSVANKMIPSKPAPYGYMSFTTDFIDPQAVIDLHTAGLKVAEGMLVAYEKKMYGLERKCFLEEYYPALAFEHQALW